MDSARPPREDDTLFYETRPNYRDRDHPSHCRCRYCRFYNPDPLRDDSPEPYRNPAEVLALGRLRIGQHHPGNPQGGGGGGGGKKKKKHTVTIEVNGPKQSKSKSPDTSPSAAPAAAAPTTTTTTTSPTQVPAPQPRYAEMLYPEIYIYPLSAPHITFPVVNYSVLTSHRPHQPPPRPARRPTCYLAICPPCTRPADIAAALTPPGSGCVVVARLSKTKTTAPLSAFGGVEELRREAIQLEVWGKGEGGLEEEKGEDEGEGDGGGEEEEEEEGKED
ncbi:uncharacterized protein GGS25DRAFT_519103 [Hypoxylon fragiforme]|uniref:uncharacterized protein n=1 Tax=Hypoxylon fragiforme TaxID=63214 RepID=UPI0020C66C6A|nr:uncharacterized protein GGS25DRAFT_519103 [Hypoxylon fragiforme]KAI2610806.1 hypothetical protein GGS25DRAFT_519103 [Hypoxylon fragiforme]